MTKRRYVPKSIVAQNERPVNDVLFRASNREGQGRQQHYQRFCPGSAPLAKAPAQQPSSDCSPCQIPSEPSANEAPSNAPSVPTNEPNELQEIFEQAAQEGFAAGIAQAQEQTQAKIDEHMHQLECMLLQILDLRQTHFESFQTQCLEIAIAGAEALARRSFRADATAIKELIFEAVGELNASSTVSLRVAPEHAPELELWVKERFSDTQVCVIGDEQLGAEDFRASCKTGSVTGNFSERLSVLRHAIFSHRGTLESPDEGKAPA